MYTNVQQGVAVLHDVTIDNEDFNDSCNLFINLVICRIWNKSLSKMYKLYKMTTVTKIFYTALEAGRTKLFLTLIYLFH